MIIFVLKNSSNVSAEVDFALITVEFIRVLAVSFRLGAPFYSFTKIFDVFPEICSLGNNIIYRYTIKL